MSEGDGQPIQNRDTLTLPILKGNEAVLSSKQMLDFVSMTLAFYAHVDNPLRTEVDKYAQMANDEQISEDNQHRLIALSEYFDVTAERLARIAGTIEGYRSQSNNGVRVDEVYNQGFEQYPISVFSLPHEVPGTDDSKQTTYKASEIAPQDLEGIIANSLVEGPIQKIGQVPAACDNLMLAMSERSNEWKGVKASAEQLTHALEVISKVLLMHAEDDNITISTKTVLMRSLEDGKIKEVRILDTDELARLYNF